MIDRPTADDLERDAAKDAELLRSVHPYLKDAPLFTLANVYLRRALHAEAEAARLREILEDIKRVAHENDLRRIRDMAREALEEQP